MTPRNPMELLSDKQFKKEFRFSKADIPRLLRCLQWPVFFSFNNRVIFSAEICLLMVLYRFAFPSTLNKLEVMFGRSSSSCSRIVTHGVSLIYARFGTRLYELDIQLVLQQIHLYQEAVSRKSKSAVQIHFAFFDGTFFFLEVPCEILLQ